MLYVTVLLGSFLLSLIAPLVFCKRDTTAEIVTSAAEDEVKAEEEVEEPEVEESTEPDVVEEDSEEPE